MAQMIRASLLATAATTTLKGRRATSHRSMSRSDPHGQPQAGQRSCAVHQLSAQIAVTPFADSEQPFPTTGRVLARRETEPRGKAAAVREDPRIDDRRYHRCRDYGASTRRPALVPRSRSISPSSISMRLSRSASAVFCVVVMPIPPGRRSDERV
jgi:hypothetical protein